MSVTDHDEDAETRTVSPRKQRPESAWSDEVRDEALRLYADHGPTEASRMLGPDGPTKSCITKWAKTEGVETLRNERTAEATVAMQATWKHRRADLANNFGEASTEFLSASREAVRNGKANDARQLIIGAAVAVDKADQLAGVSGPNGVQVFVVDLEEALVMLERAQAQRELGAGTSAIDVDSSEVDRG